LPRMVSLRKRLHRRSCASQARSTMSMEMPPWRFRILGLLSGDGDTPRPGQVVDSFACEDAEQAGFAEDTFRNSCNFSWLDTSCPLRSDTTRRGHRKQNQRRRFVRQSADDFRHWWPRVAVAVFCLATSMADLTQAAHAASQEKSGADRATLDVSSLLSGCDVGAIQSMSGVIFRMRDPQPQLDEVARAWSKIGTAHDAAPPCLREVEVQIYLADVLAQAQANKFDLDVDSASVATFLRAQTGNSDPTLAFVAITGLGYLAETSDLKLFARLIQTSSGPSRLAAIQSLALHCSPEASKLLEKTADPTVLSEAERYSAVRRVRCSSQAAR
jgi:hypothetical protein